MEGLHVLQRRHDPPAFQSRQDINPTLLVSWFCTILSLICILIRLLGRWVRTEKLFREDKVMFWSIIPLLGRMGFVHVVLIWGTNNTMTDSLDRVQIQQRMVGSKLVLPARILYALYIWTAKITILEFLRRLIGQSWIKSYENGMRIIYGFLGFTLAAVVVSTLAECQPFTHYWQVIPDPGEKCRAATAQLLTMGVCDIVTDLVLMAFPIPLVVMSAMRMKRKVSLILLFLLSLGPLAITAYRIPSTIRRGSPQQFRSLLASIEILAATGVANAIVIGSFVRDRGVKKAKFRAASLEGSTLSRQQTRTKSIAVNNWGDDEDLVRDLGLSVQPALRHASTAGNNVRPAPVAPPGPISQFEDSPARRPAVDMNWNFNRAGRRRRKHSLTDSMSSNSMDLKMHDLRSSIADDPPSPGATRTDPKMSFFDVGGLIDEPSEPVRSGQNISPPNSPTSANLFLSDVGGLFGSSQPPRQDDEIRQIMSDSPHLGPTRGTTRGEDIKDFLRSASPFRRSGQFPRGRSSPRHSQLFTSSPSVRPIDANAGPDDLDISDAGGLLK